MEFPLLVIPFILVALVGMFLAGEAWQRRQSAGSMSFVLLMLGACLWLVATGGSMASTLPGHKIFLAKAAYFVIAWMPTLWVTFSLELSTQNNQLFTRYGWLLWIIPSLTIIAVTTNDLHHWFWTEIIETAAGGVVYQRGFLFWIFVVYSYLLLASASVILARGLLRFPAYHRRQVAALVIGMALPWFSNLSFLAGWIPQTSVDLAPFALAIAGFLYSWTLYRLRLFDPVPLAREAILEQLDEGYLALDLSGRILDANAVAQRMLNLEERALLRGDSRAVLKRWPALLSLLQTPGTAHMEFRAAETPDLFLEASLSYWYGRGARAAGRILTLHDITRRKVIEEQLRESEQMYRLLVHSLPVGVATMDVSGAVLFASPEMIKLFGVGVETKVVGQKVIDWLHPNDRRRAADALRQVLQGAEEIPTSLMFQLLKADGQDFWGEISSARLMDEQNEVRGVLSIIRDVTQQRELKLQLQHNLERQTLINGLLQLLYGPQKLNDVLAEILELVGYFFHASRVYLCQDSREGDRTLIVAEWTHSGYPRAQGSLLFNYAALPSWQLWMETRGRVILPLENTHEPTMPQDLTVFMDAWNALSLAAVPIYGSEKCRFGFLGLDDSDARRVWEVDELEVLGQVANFLSSAIAQKQIEEAEEQARLMNEALQDTARVLTSTLNLDEVLDHILANLEKVVAFDSASIAMIYEEEQKVYFVRWRGYDAGGDELMRYNRLPLGERATYRNMILNGAPVIIADTWQDQGWVVQKDFVRIRSYAGAPIRVKDQVVGFINLDSNVTDYFTQDMLARLTMFADQAAVAIGNARLYEQMRQMAITDTVTRLATRRHFTVLGQSEIERAQRYARPVAVLMVDIDRFKKVNDTHGHFAGDQVLQAVARTCSQALRASDIIGRWGGEEFTVLLPEADRDGALLIAERIRHMVEACEIRLPDGTAVQVTVSLGLANLNGSNSTLERLVDCADRAMYAAKLAGRNQVKVCEDPA